MRTQISVNYFVSCFVQLVKEVYVHGLSLLSNLGLQVLSTVFLGQSRNIAYSNTVYYYTSETWWLCSKLIDVTVK